MRHSLGFDYQREINEQADTDYTLGGVGSTLKGLGDKVAGLVTAIYAYPTPIDGVYPRTTYPINHAIDVITESSKAFLPIGTIQRGREDWMNCASNAPANEIEKQHNYAIENKLFSPALIQWFKDKGYINPENGKFEIADAYISIGSKTTRQGNSLKSPVQFISNEGIIPKSMCPDSPSMDFDEYHDPTRITQAMKDLGQEYLKRVKISYEKVYRNDFNNVIDKPRWDIFDSYEENPNDNVRRLAEDYIFHSYAYCLYINENDTTKEQISIIKRMINLLLEVIGLKKKLIVELEDIIIKDPEPVVEEPEPKYLWATREQACHSVRVLCDEEGLSVAEKNALASTVNCESGFHTDAYNLNSNGSYDTGIVQVNSHYWIGEGKKFPSKEYVNNNPEECVRWMCREWKRNKNWWICYKTAKYKNYACRV